MTDTEGSDEGELRTVEVSVTGIMGIDVQPGESVEEATRRELKEEMTDERRRSFFDDANFNIDDLGTMGVQEGEQ